MAFRNFGEKRWRLHHPSWHPHKKPEKDLLPDSNVKTTSRYLFGRLAKPPWEPKFDHISQTHRMMMSGPLCISSAYQMVLVLPPSVAAEVQVNLLFRAYPMPPFLMGAVPLCSPPLARPHPRLYGNFCLDRFCRTSSLEHRCKGSRRRRQ